MTTKYQKTELEEITGLAVIPAGVDDQIHEVLSKYEAHPLMSIDEVTDAHIKTALVSLQNKSVSAAQVDYTLPQKPEVTETRGLVRRAYDWFMWQVRTDAKRKEMAKKNEEQLTVKRAEAQYAWVVQCRNTLGNAGQTLQSSYRGIQDYKERLETLLENIQVAKERFQEGTTHDAVEMLNIETDIAAYRQSLAAQGLSHDAIDSAVSDFTGQKATLGKKIAATAAQKEFLDKTSEYYRNLAQVAQNKLALISGIIRGAREQLFSVQQAISQYEGLVVHEGNAAKALAFLEATGDLTNEFLETQLQLDQNLEAQASRYEVARELDRATAMPSIVDLNLIDYKDDSKS